MGAWTSRARVPKPELGPQETLDLSRLPPELLLLVLSHVPPRSLLSHCRRVCRAWRAAVDGQALWLLVLARDGSAAGRALLTLARRCLPPAREGVPCPLGQFCARRPIGRNLISNPCGQEILMPQFPWCCAYPHVSLVFTSQKACASGWCSMVGMAGWWRRT